MDWGGASPRSIPDLGGYAFPLVRMSRLAPSAETVEYVLWCSTSKLTHG